MYVPRTNAEDDPAVLAAFMRAHPLAALVSAGSTGELWATHLPVVVDETRGPHGTIEGHIARANMHHKLVRANDGAESLMIFTGPDAYVTPSWYPGKAEHGREVPTWNYIAVHAYGVLRLHDDPAWLHAHLTRLTDRNEATRPVPWRVSDAPADYIDKLLGAIVGVELEITRFDARWKMSQNRTHAEIDGVVDGLRASDHAMDRQVAEIVEARRPGR